MDRYTGGTIVTKVLIHKGQNTEKVMEAIKRRKKLALALRQNSRQTVGKFL